MDTAELFLASDAALRSVLDRLTPELLATPVPPEWSRVSDHPTMRDILWAHAYDEAWIPDVLAGKAIADGDPWLERDLLGADPIASYDALHDTATAAVRAGVAPAAMFRFQYGDYPAAEGFAHLATYRGFQAWSIAHLLSLPFHLTPELIDGLNEHVVPEADTWRQWGVFPPAIESPADADPETRLLCAVGYWKP
ncbi:MAG: hypothetical protein HY996_08345 [Micrococcales bacterium]|nr:hypothetical protein [Micrococcales bacterium]